MARPLARSRDDDDDDDQWGSSIRRRPARVHRQRRRAGAPRAAAPRWTDTDDDCGASSISDERDADAAIGRRDDDEPLREPRADAALTILSVRTALRSRPSGCCCRCSSLACETAAAGRWSTVAVTGGLSWCAEARSFSESEPGRGQDSTTETTVLGSRSDGAVGALFLCSRPASELGRHRQRVLSPFFLVRGRWRAGEARPDGDDADRARR